MGIKWIINFEGYLKYTNAVSYVKIVYIFYYKLISLHANNTKGFYILFWINWIFYKLWNELQANISYIIVSFIIKLKKFLINDILHN